MCRFSSSNTILNIICLTNTLFYSFIFIIDFDYDQNVITDFTYSTGQRGCQQLVYDNFTYVKNSINRQRTIWKCSRKVSSICFNFIVAVLLDKKTLFRFYRSIHSICMNGTIDLYLDLQGSRRCRAKIITDLINGEIAIVNVKGTHNHPVIIKRNKPLGQLVGRRTRASKIGPATDDQYQQYQDCVYVEDDDESNNI